MAKKTDQPMIPMMPLYGDDSFVMGLSYEGLDYSVLDEINENFGINDFGKVGCSITFAHYFDGTIGAVRNMDLQFSNYCAYELAIHPGENVKYATWGLSYSGIDTKSYKDVLKNGITLDRYKKIPFACTDAMSFGLDKNGKKASLYIGSLMRADEPDEKGGYLWQSPDTYPGAPLKVNQFAGITIAATQCICIQDVLEMVGAVDVKFKRISKKKPTMSLFSNNHKTNKWFFCYAMCDSTGRHGVLEIIDNKPIWHEGIDFSFNFFLHNDFLFNKDGTYKERYGAGIGRYLATVPYLDRIRTKEDHLMLMDNIRYSHFTFYDEEMGYTGHDWEGNPIDWRSELTGHDTWGDYEYFQKLGLSTKEADERFKLEPCYLDTKTNQVRVVDYKTWKKEKDHLKVIYTMEYVQDPRHEGEMRQLLNWSGAFFNSLDEKEIRMTNKAWNTYFRVIVDPMRNTVTRWFTENISTADTIVYEDLYDE